MLTLERKQKKKLDFAYRGVAKFNDDLSPYWRVALMA